MARVHTARHDPDLDAMLGAIQNDLFDLGADLATLEAAEKPIVEPLRIVAAQVERLERDIDALNERLARCAPSCCRAARRRRPRCIWRAPWQGGPSGWWSNCRAGPARESAGGDEIRQPLSGFPVRGRARRQ
jgi:hypothetical protein